MIEAIILSIYCLIVYLIRENRSNKAVIKSITMSFNNKYIVKEISNHLEIEKPFDSRYPLQYKQVTDGFNSSGLRIKKEQYLSEKTFNAMKKGLKVLGE